LGLLLELGISPERSASQSGDTGVDLSEQLRPLVQLSGGNAARVISGELEIGVSRIAGNDLRIPLCTQKPTELPSFEVAAIPDEYFREGYGSECR